MGVLAPVSAHAGHSTRTPIDTSGNFPSHVSAELPSNISPNPSEVKSEVSELYDKPLLDIFDFSQFSGQNRVNWGRSGGPRNFFGDPPTPSFNPILTEKSANFKYILERLVVEF